MSSIRALQSSTTSHKLLESVRSLRPLLCEALRVSGFDAIDFTEQDLALHGAAPQIEDVQYLNSHDIFSVEELTNLHPVSAYHGHIHDHDINADYHGSIHEDPHVQHRNLWHVTPPSHNCANEGDAIPPFVDVQHHGNGHYHDAHHHGYMKYVNAEYGLYGNVYPHEFEHNGDAYYRGYGHHGDAYHHGQGHEHHGDAHPHGHEHGYNTNSIVVSTDNHLLDDCPELPVVQKNQKQIVHMSFSNSFPLAREFVEVDIPCNSLSCSQYPQADNHLLHHQHIHAHHSQQQYTSSNPLVFMNSALLGEAAGSIINEAVAAQASKQSNNNDEGLRAQNSPACTMNNVEVHEADTGLKANCRELPPLPKSCKHKKRPPKSMPKQLESSGKSEGTDNEEGGNLSSLKHKATISNGNLFSERRRRKKWNVALYTLRALVPIVSKMDKLSIVSDTLTYLHQLKDKVDNLQNDIHSLQLEKDVHSVHSPEDFSSCTSQEMKTCKDSPKHKISELDVHLIDMEQKTYHLCIRCAREVAVLPKLTKALEALNCNMLNANIAAINKNQILYTAVVKVESAEVLQTPDMLKESVLKSARMYGFLF